MWLTIVFGGDPKYFRLPYAPKPLFWENLQLKPMDGVSAFFLTSDKAIVTKLDQTTKEIELYKKLRIWGQKGRDQGHVTDF